MQDYWHTHILLLACIYEVYKNVEESFQFIKKKESFLVLLFVRWIQITCKSSSSSTALSYDCVSLWFYSSKSCQIWVDCIYRKKMWCERGLCLRIWKININFCVSILHVWTPYGCFLLLLTLKCGIWLIYCKILILIMKKFYSSRCWWRKLQWKTFLPSFKHKKKFVRRKVQEPFSAINNVDILHSFNLFTWKDVCQLEKSSQFEKSIKKSSIWIFSNLSWKNFFFINFLLSLHTIFSPSSSSGLSRVMIK